MKWLKILFVVIALFGIGFLGYMKSANKNTSEVGLSIFSWFKNVKGDNVKIAEMTSSKLKSLDHSEWSTLLDKFVSSDGKVDYRGFAKNKSKFDQYLDYLSQNAPATNWTKSEKLCYWINSYNAFTVKLILDHYPIKSIKDISDGLPIVDSPWDIKFFKIGGVDFDLGTIEHEVLRKQFDEPRIHFAINCASVSCPILRNEAYLPRYLEDQLDDQAKGFINDKSKNLISASELKLSSIFKWFESDFTKDGSLHSFLKEYNKDVDEGTEISYLDYDWGLNG